MFLVDTSQGRIIADEEIKSGLAAKQPYRKWLDKNQLRLDQLPELPTNGQATNGSKESSRLELQRAFGYTLEDLRIIMEPMVVDAKEPLGSMGNDTPLAVLSDRPQVLYNYFKQLFAQVTNPPLDAIREELVTSLITTIGSEGNLLAETPEQCRLLRLDQPVITDAELKKIKSLDQPGLKSRTLSILFEREEGPAGMRKRLDALRKEATQAVEDGITIIILSDRGLSRQHAAIPALLAVSGVHHHLIREGTRTHCGLVIETGEAREVHHFALLTGYGAGAVNPYLAFATIRQLQHEGYIPEKFSDEQLDARYINAINKGLLKVMSKMGISTQQSYRGAQIYEAIGLNQEFIDEFFSWTPSRISGIGLEGVAEESLQRHDHAFPPKNVPEVLGLDVGGQYQWRRKGEAHVMSPEVVAKLQESSRLNDPRKFSEFSALIDKQDKHC